TELRNSDTKSGAGADQIIGQNQQAKAQAATRVDLLGDSPPKTIAEFHEFWLSAPGLDPIGSRGRVPARGKANARLMVLVIDPEEHDSETLLSGPQGELLTNFIAATDVDESEVYFASALTRHTPMADTATIAASGMETVLAHHISLAAPERVIAFGANILPLLGHNPTKDIHSLHEINQGNPRMPLLVSEGLDSLMSMPRLKARFWRRWNEWSAKR
ncbi:MAG: uracil-DNA glycosylase family protein, partial [Pseudomonadota bacterium]